VFGFAGDYRSSGPEVIAVLTSISNTVWKRILISYFSLAGFTFLASRDRGLLGVELIAKRLC